VTQQWKRVGTPADPFSEKTGKTAKNGAKTVINGPFRTVFGRATEGLGGNGKPVLLEQAPEEARILLGLGLGGGRRQGGLRDGRLGERRGAAAAQESLVTPLQRRQPLAEGAVAGGHLEFVLNLESGKW